MEQNRPPIFLYTDGAASGNPGPGGYGVVLCCGNLRKEFSGGFRLTTNNRMDHNNNIFIFKNYHLKYFLKMNILLL